MFYSAETDKIQAGFGSEKQEAINDFIRGLLIISVFFSLVSKSYAVKRSSRKMILKPLFHMLDSF